MNTFTVIPCRFRALRRSKSKAFPLACFIATSLLFTGAAQSGGYEVWLSDQTNTQNILAGTPNGTHGGLVYIYDGADLEQTPAINNPVGLDVSSDLFPGASTTTGAEVARIHGILPSPDHRYMALNFVASGHLGIVDGETKTAICLFRTTGTTTGRQNHMSFWSPDGNRLLVANQNGRMLERIDVHRDSSGNVSAFTFNAAASLDMVGGAGRVTAQPIAVDMDAGDGINCTVSGIVADGQSTTTPNGALKQEAGVRPTNTLICPLIASNSQHAFATLGGGGMFVIDITTAPMSIVAEYGLSVVRAAGCGGIEAAGYMHLNTGTPGPDISEFSIYRFPANYPSAPAFNAPNTPAPVAVFFDPDNGKVLPGTNRDAHGMVLVRNVASGAPRYLHQFDRVRNNVEVFKISPPWNSLENRHEGSYSLTTTGVCGSTTGATTNNDPTPDLGDLSIAGSPDGGRIFIALRGPNPLSVSHAAVGSCPGLGIVTLSPDRKSGELGQVLGTSTLNFSGTINNSDPHAAIVRIKTD